MLRLYLSDNVCQTHCIATWKNSTSFKRTLIRVKIALLNGFGKCRATSALWDDKQHSNQHKGISTVSEKKINIYQQWKIDCGLTCGVSWHLNDALALLPHLPGVEGSDPHCHLDWSPRHAAAGWGGMGLSEGWRSVWPGRHTPCTCRRVERKLLRLLEVETCLQMFLRNGKLGFVFCRWWALCPTKNAEWVISGTH